MTQLRVALVAGTLGRGGAEKQLVYMARALRDASVDVRIYSLTRDEPYAAALARMGLEPIWIGRRRSVLARLHALDREMSRFRPHVLQAGHFYVNLYVAIIAKRRGAIGIGGIRGNTYHDVRTNGVWGRWLLRAPSALITNSRAAWHSTQAFGIPPERVHLVPNVIDLFDFDARSVPPAVAVPAVVSVASLIQVKRLDRFLHALARARAQGCMVRGAIVGDGPERSRLESMACDLGLLPDGVAFLGQRSDVPAVLRSAQMLLLTSDSEGFPNVILEAMAAGIPVVSTPAGDAPVIVEDGVTGHLVDFDEVNDMARHLCALASDAALRGRMGRAARVRVERMYTCDRLAPQLLDVYRATARLGGAREIARVLG